MKFEVINIDGILNNKFRFEAHKKETIKEHTDRCVDFFKKICAAKNLDDVFEKIKREILKSNLDECKELFEKCMINIFAFHDIGKINPTFQYVKMEKSEFKNESGNNGMVELGSKHSLLSAILYL